MSREIAAAVPPSLKFDPIRNSTASQSLFVSWQYQGPATSISLSILSVDCGDPDATVIANLTLNRQLSSSVANISIPMNATTESWQRLSAFIPPAFNFLSNPFFIANTSYPSSSSSPTDPHFSSGPSPLIVASAARTSPDIPTSVIIGITAGGFAVFLAVILIAIRPWRKSTKEKARPSLSQVGRPSMNRTQDHLVGPRRAHSVAYTDESFFSPSPARGNTPLPPLPLPSRATSIRSMRSLIPSWLDSMKSGHSVGEDPRKLPEFELQIPRRPPPMLTHEEMDVIHDAFRHDYTPPDPFRRDSPYTAPQNPTFSSIDIPTSPSRQSLMSFYVKNRNYSYRSSTFTGTTLRDSDDANSSYTHSPSQSLSKRSGLKLLSPLHSPTSLHFDVTPEPPLVVNDTNQPFYHFQQDSFPLYHHYDGQPILADDPRREVDASSPNFSRPRPYQRYPPIEPF
jgi:hypothetical protein